MNDLAYLGIAILLGAIVQGLSGLGFSLVTAPAAAQLIPSSSAIGLVNLLGLVQNIWGVWSKSGDISWKVIRRLGPGLIIGCFVAVIPLKFLDRDLQPLFIALCALVSVGAYVWWKPPAEIEGSALSAGAFGGAINTYAGVGEEPIMAYLERQKWQRADYERTLQVIAGVMNLVSIPLLGLPSMEPLQLVVGIALIPIGVLIGKGIARFFEPRIALKIAQYFVVLVGVAAIVRSLILLETS